MTAEVAILNSNAIAIAADSAVTIGLGKKIYNSAIKVFTLSKVAPVAIMVYGNAGLLGVPWETIIKIYRSEMKQRTFNTLEEYAQHFLEFLPAQERFFPSAAVEKEVVANVRGYFKLIRDEFLKSVEDKFKISEDIDATAITHLFEDLVARHWERLQGETHVAGMSRIDETAFIKRYRKTLKNIEQEIFQNVAIRRTTSIKLSGIAASLHTRELFLSEGHSGVVICGFGDHDVFPSVITHLIDGVVHEKLKYKFSGEKSYRIRDGGECAIIPFAQEDMVASFMEGMNPVVRRFTEHYMNELFLRLPELVDDADLVGSVEKKSGIKRKLRTNALALLGTFFKELEFHKRQEHVDPILSMVRVLPKDELAAMAEALVNLTAFKRRMTDELETVGGPIDVAVISKGDGLVWVRRKHYFAPELNQHFFSNYFREVGNGQS